MCKNETLRQRIVVRSESKDKDIEYGNLLGEAHNQERWHKVLQDGPNANFSWSAEAEPHKERRRKILKAHPEIKTLFRTDIISAYFCICQVLFQFGMAYACTHMPWWMVCILTYTVSGFMNQSLQLAMHELSHDLWFKNRRMNMYFSFLANLPTCVPSSATFRRYHLEHHTYQGVDGVDEDIPSHVETFLLRYTAGKILFVMFTCIFYSLRPLLQRPKSPNKDEIINQATIIISNFIIYNFLGAKALFYLGIGSIWGMGLHPMAGHFISEHFEFIPGQETYSYYGPLNYITYNVGYHNEHHDFPKIPGRLLPQVTAMAPEFYLTIPSYTSWLRVLYDFFFYKNVSLWSRVKRNEDTMIEKTKTSDGVESSGESTQPPDSD